MLCVCDSRELLERAIQYLKSDYIKTPYLYVDICKYGLGTDNVKTWIDLHNDKIQGVFLLYFDCLHFYTKTPSQYDLNILKKTIYDLNPKVVMVQGEIGIILESALSFSYSVEKNYVLDMSSVNFESVNNCFTAGREDIEKIVDLLMMDSLYQSVFEKDKLLKQMIERYDDNFSRYFVIKDNDIITATCSTYGEFDNVALIGSVMVHPYYRRRGLASNVERYACDLLKKEGKIGIGFVNYNNIASIKLHESIGCKKVSMLYKFVKK